MEALASNQGEFLTSASALRKIHRRDGSKATSNEHEDQLLLSSLKMSDADLTDQLSLNFSKSSFNDRRSPWDYSHACTHAIKLIVEYATTVQGICMITKKE